MHRGIRASRKVQVVCACGEARPVQALQAQIKDVTQDAGVVPEIQIRIGIAAIVEWASRAAIDTTDADGV